MTELKFYKENLKKTSLLKNKKGVATKKALTAQRELYSERIPVRKNIYDDYTGNLINDDPEIEALLDIVESFQHFTSRFEKH